MITDSEKLKYLKKWKSMTKYIANHSPLTPLLFLERAAAFYKDKTAIVQDNISKTYGTLYSDCTLTAMRFRELGVQPGDRIAYISRNNHQLLEAHYAVPMCGAILVPINYRLNEKEVSYILKHAAVKVLVTEEQYYHESYSDIVEVHLFINSENLYKQHPLNKYKAPRINEDDTISLNYTSGTTGHPKGVMYSHRSTYLNTLGECITASLTADCNYLWILPMFHCNGWCYTWAVTAIGGTHFFTDSFDPEYVVSYITGHKITHLCAAPTVLIQLQQAINFSLLRNYGKLTIITAGSAPAPDTIRRFEENDVKIIHVYGLTETHGPHSVCETSDRSRQGIASVHAVFMNVVDDELHPVARDGKTIGEVVVRGNNIMQGYYKDVKLTRQAFKGGWFHTGDLAVIHPDGHAEIVDRKKDLIISGGENISSIEVENVLYQHPDILLAAVIPVYDHKWGEIPKAVIELKQGKSVSDKEIIDFCRDKLAHYKCPKAVIFDTIPKTNTGKVQKNKLKEKYYYHGK